jgi:hypothetical protein
MLLVVNDVMTDSFGLRVRVSTNIGRPERRSRFESHRLQIGKPASLRTKSATAMPGRQINCRRQGSPEGNKKPRQPRVDHMFALVEGHPNIDVMIFYVFAAAILAATLYRFNRKQI